MSEPSVVGIDASRYAIRAAVTGAHSEILHAIEAKAHEPNRVVDFVRDCFRSQPSLRLIASPLDDWPNGLLPQLEQVGTPVSWLPPTLVRGTATEASDWQRQRRLQRARFYAWLHRQQKQDRCWSSLELVLAWEEYLATESRSRIAHEREKHGLSDWHHFNVKGKL